MTEIRPATSGEAAQIRRRYEHAKLPFCSTARARRDVLSLLEERKLLRRAAERMLAAALPYSGDQALKEAIDVFRDALEGRSGG